MYILNMKNSKFIIDKFAKLIEQGLVSSKDLTTELFNILKSKRDEFVFKMKLTSKDEFEVLSKRVENLENKINKLEKKKNTNLFIIIDDDGPGIPKNEYENVFKPFYKIDKSRADSKSSVGLGLSISSDIIKSHGGNIMLEKSKMDGLRVKVFLPV